MFFAVIGSFFIAVVIKMATRSIEAQRSSYVHCYMLSLIGISVLWGLLQTRFFFNGFVILLLEFLVFFVGALMVLEARPKGALVIAAVCSSLLTVSVTLH